MLQKSPWRPLPRDMRDKVSPTVDKSQILWTQFASSRSDAVLGLLLRPKVSQNPRIVRVGRGPSGSSSPTPLPKQVHLQQVGQVSLMLSDSHSFHPLGSHRQKKTPSKVCYPPASHSNDLCMGQFGIRHYWCWSRMLRWPEAHSWRESGE